AGTAHLAAGTSRRIDRIACIEQHGAAPFHVGVYLFKRGLRGLRRVRGNRPIDYWKKCKLVERKIETDRIGSLQRRALRKKKSKSLQPGFAHFVDGGIAGDDVRKMRLQRRLHGEVLLLRCERRGLLR